MRKLWGIPAYCMQGYWWILQWEALSRFWITPWQSTAKKIWSKPTNVKLFIQRWYEVARCITTPPPPNPPSQPSPTFSGTHSGTVRIKCFAQDHSTLTRPGLDPRCLGAQRTYAIASLQNHVKQASLLLLVTCWSWFSFSLCSSNHHHHHYYCQCIIANIFITIKISII